jgi:hypothetical protein
MNTQLSTLDVLIADADVALHQLLGPRLAREGFNVHSAFNCEEAMTSIAIAPPHALIINLELPHGCGEDVVSSVGDLAAVFIVRPGEPLDCGAIIRGLQSQFAFERRVETWMRRASGRSGAIVLIESDPDVALFLDDVSEAQAVRFADRFGTAAGVCVCYQREGSFGVAMELAKAALQRAKREGRTVSATEWMALSA